MNVKKITIGDKQFTIKANALLPRRYRNEFNKDLITDLNKLISACKAQEGIDWEVAENLTWLMIKTAGVDEIGSIEDWLDTIEDTLAIPMAFPEVLSIWEDNQKTTSVPRKK